MSPAFTTSICTQTIAPFYRTAPAAMIDTFASSTNTHFNAAWCVTALATNVGGAFTAYTNTQVIATCLGTTPAATVYYALPRRSCTCHLATTFIAAPAATMAFAFAKCTLC